MLGSFVLSSGYYDAYYLKALRTKALIKQAFDKAFAKYDVILGPAAPTTAPKLGESLSDPLKMYLGDVYTVSVNLAGLPGISVPCGLDKNGLPIIARIPRSDDIIRFEDEGKTVIEGDPELEVSRHFLELARKLLEQEREENRSENGSE